MTKISQLSDIGANLAANDEFIIRDVSDASTPNKKVTSSGFIDYVISQGSVTGFTQIAAGVGPLARVRTISSGTTGTVLFETANGGSIVERGRVDPAGRFLVGLASANTSGAKLQTSDGLTFPATQVASSDPNTLDDYEEGTWTPTIVGSTTAGTVSYYDRNGNYTKIGRVVYITLYVNWHSGTGTGDLRISGLPFTGSAGGAGVPNTLSVGFVANLTAPAGTFPSAAVDNGNAYISIHQQTTAPTYESFNRVNIAYDGQANFIIHGFYLVS